MAFHCFTHAFTPVVQRRVTLQLSKLCKGANTSLRNKYVQRSNTTLETTSFGNRLSMKCVYFVNALLFSFTLAAPPPPSPPPHHLPLQLLSISSPNAQRYHIFSPPPPFLPLFSPTAHRYYILPPPLPPTHTHTCPFPLQLSSPQVPIPFLSNCPKISFLAPTPTPHVPFPHQLPTDTTFLAPPPPPPSPPHPIPLPLE